MSEYSQSNIRREENAIIPSITLEQTKNEFDSRKTMPILEPEESCLHQFIHKKTLRGRKEKLSLPKDKLKCELCLKYYNISLDDIISCTKCKCVFHPKCHENLKKNPCNCEDNYLCDRCTHALNSNEPINTYKCFICNNSDGVLDYNSETKVFYHKICFNFINELQDVSKTEITKNQIRRWRYKNSCRYCGKKLNKNEVVLKCKNPKCKEYFHIPCAIQKGLIFDLDFMKNFYNVESYSQIPFFCSNHNKKISGEYKNYIVNGISPKSINMKNQSNEKTSLTSEEIISTNNEEKCGLLSSNKLEFDSISDKFSKNDFLGSNWINFDWNGNVNFLENNNEIQNNSFTNSLLDNNNNYYCFANDAKEDFFNELPFMP